MLSDLAARGFEVWLDGGQLRYRGPENAVTAETLGRLREAKAEIVAWLEAEEARPFPVTSGQRALWFLHRADPSSRAYHVRFTVDLAEGVEAARIDRAMQELAARHPVIRTCFRVEGGEPVQFVRSDLEWRLRERDLAWGESPEAEADEPFDLECGPVCRITLFRRAEGGQTLQITAHHIAFDFAALEILISELRSCYAGAKLPRVAATYRGHAEAEARRLAGEDGNRLRRFWQSELPGPLPMLAFPSGRPRPTVQTWHGETQYADLPADLTAGLRDLAHAEGATLYTVMLAAWQTLLFRHTHQEDLIVGTPVRGRGRPELELVVGYFANAIPIRMRFAPRMTFRELLGETRRRVLNSVAHGEYPLPTLIEDLQIERDPARSPVFQTTFVWNQRDAAAAPGHSGDPLYTNRFSSEQRGACYDISLSVYDVAGPLRLALAYNLDLFDRAEAAAIARRFEQLLRSIAANPDGSLDHLQMDAAPQILGPLPEGSGQRSFHQERISFIDQFETGKVYAAPPTYHNLIGTVPFEGEPDGERFRTALQALVKRHGWPDTPEFRIAEWSDDAIEREREGPFDLVGELPLRGALFTGANVLALTIHQYLADTATVRLLLDEWLAIYRDAALAPARSYAGYAARQRNMAADEVETLRRYWFHTLRGRLQPLTLPYDHPRAPIHVYRPGVIECEAGDRTGEVELLAAFAGMLRRYSGQEEIVIGVADAGREEFADIAGPLSNLLVLRARIDDSTTTGSLVRQMRELLAAAREHREMPFDRLVTELNPPKDMSRTALFDVLFSLHGQGDSPVEVSAVGHGKYDLHLFVSGRRAQLVFNRELFDEATAAGMARGWSRMLGTLRESKTVDEIDLAENVEQAAEPVEWPRTATIPSLFASAVRRFPGRIAVSCGGRSMTYRELDERSNHLAGRLIEAGVQREELVALLLDRDELLPAAILGALKAGAAYLPLDPTIPPARLAFILEDTGCRRAIVSPARAEALPPEIQRLIVGNGLAAQAPTVELRPEDLAYCIYTSGSTGQPKGVLLEHRQVVRLFFHDRPLFDFDERDVWTLFHSYSFDFSVWELFGALLFGGRLVVVPSETAANAPAMLELLRAEGVTILNQTPPAFGPLAEEAIRQKPELALRLIVFGGQQLDAVKLKAWHREYPGVKLINMYGITETCVFVTYREILAADMERAFSPIGRPIPTMETYIVDRALRPVPRGATGELLVGGDGLARGYLNRPELTQERFIPHPFRAQGRVYRSGDCARQTANGDLIYEGRMDDQMQVRGFRVELGEIRCALLKQRVVADAHVAPWGSGDEAELAAWVVPRMDVRETERRLARFRREAKDAEWARFELPNGMVIATRNASETEFTYEEIFEQNSYLRNGVTLSDGAVVIDAGANIGMFSVFAATACRGARVIALEPIPQTYAILRVNAGVYDLGIEALNCGVAAREQTAVFTHYPNVSIFSGRFADGAKNREIIGAYIRNQARQAGEAAPSDAEIETILEERFQGEPVEGRLRTISQIIRERSLDRVDLLKLDVERSELEALAGIEDGDWPKIRQIVIETHGGPAEAERIAERLQERGFAVSIEQEQALENTPVANLFAVREQGQSPDASRFLTRANPMANSAPALTREIRAQLRRELPEYMLPGAIVLVDALPLNANGKVNAALLPPPDRAAASTAEFVAPRGPLEEQIAGIWAEALEVARVGAFDNFFDLGGHSLLAMRLISRMRQSFGIEFPVHAIFQNPTVAGAAEIVRRLEEEHSEDMEELLEELEGLSEEEAAERLSSFSEEGGAA
jgi:amino acid adenylation domain-containing protein/FkbM family methyltransferase